MTKSASWSDKRDCGLIVGELRRRKDIGDDYHIYGKVFVTEEPYSGTTDSNGTYEIHPFDKIGEVNIETKEVILEEEI